MCQAASQALLDCLVNVSSHTPAMLQIPPCYLCCHTGREWIPWFLHHHSLEGGQTVLCVLLGGYHTPSPVLTFYFFFSLKFPSPSNKTRTRRIATLKSIVTFLGCSLDSLKGSRWQVLKGKWERDTVRGERGAESWGVTGRRWEERRGREKGRAEREWDWWENGEYVEVATRQTVKWMKEH